MDREWSKEIMETKSGKKEIKKKERDQLFFFFLVWVQKRRSYQDRQDHKCGFYLNEKRAYKKKKRKSIGHIVVQYTLLSIK